MKTVLPFLLAVMPMFSCENSRQPTSVKQPSPEEQISGEWRNIYAKVTMRTIGNSDSSRVMEVREEDWEAAMQMKPIRTFFRKDGTYNSEHRNLNDSLVYNPAGKWIVVGDSIFMTDTFPQPGLSYKYKLIITDSIAEFWGVEDFDQDGFKDDEYYGSQRRQ